MSRCLLSIIPFTSASTPMSVEKVYLLHNLFTNARATVPFTRICETLDCSPATAHRVIKTLREGHGAEVEVLAPAELRQEVAPRHRAAAALYS